MDGRKGRKQKVLASGNVTPQKVWLNFKAKITEILRKNLLDLDEKKLTKLSRNKITEGGGKKLM
jgi:hypothetical protein